MRAWARNSVILLLSAVCICLYQAGAQAQTPTTSIQGAQGGDIVYGSVSGVTTQPAAIAKLLRFVHSDCGERPQIGRVFRFRGTDSVGVFFTVVNHPHGEKHVAGLIIATATGPNQVEAAILSDDSSRFGKTVNPMLQQLFSQWHPGAQAVSSEPASKAKTPPTSGGSAPAAALHRVVTSDNSASVGLPDGWTLDPTSGGGTPSMKGPHGERIGLNMAQSGLDLNDPTIRSLGGTHSNNQGRIVLPFNVDLTRAYPEVLRQWRHNNGNDAPMNWQNTHAERMPTQRGAQCVHITGNIVDDEKQNDETSMILCTGDYLQGNYEVNISQSLIPVELASRERATAGAIMASLQVNQGVVQQQANAMAAPTIIAIHAIGDAAAARMKASEAASDAQHDAYWARQDANARQSKARSDYMLDQTVVQNNDVNGTGTVGRATVWNSTADALVKADPNKYEYVDTSNYIKGLDY
jgi:hypothetical protein